MFKSLISVCFLSPSVKWNIIWEILELVKLKEKKKKTFYVAIVLFYISCDTERCFSHLNKQSYILCFSQIEGSILLIFYFW